MRVFILSEIKSISSLKQFVVTERDDWKCITEYMRTLCDTESGVPLSLEFSASYLNFKIRCLQALKQKGVTITAYMDHAIHGKYDNGVVSISRNSVLVPHKSCGASEHVDENADI